jgi:hypothetical protein
MTETTSLVNIIAGLLMLNSVTIALAQYFDVRHRNSIAKSKEILSALHLDAGSKGGNPTVAIFRGYLDNLQGNIKGIKVVPLIILLALPIGTYPILYMALLSYPDELSKLLVEQAAYGTLLYFSLIDIVLFFTLIRMRWRTYVIKKTVSKLLTIHAAIKDSLEANPWIDEYGCNRMVDPFEKSR